MILNYLTPLLTNIIAISHCVPEFIESLMQQGERYAENGFSGKVMGQETSEPPNVYAYM